MRAVVSSWAWLPKVELPELKQEQLRQTLTCHLKPTMPGEEVEPLQLYCENSDVFGVPRAWFMKHRGNVETHLDMQTLGEWPGDLEFNGTLRDDQKEALDALLSAFKGGSLGGLLQAPCGFGKTVTVCALIQALQVPTLVVVHKEFLMKQWEERIRCFLPGARIGKIQQDTLDVVGCHVVLAMVHTLSAKYLPEYVVNWPSLVVTDEVHRIGAKTWSVVPGKFPAKWRLGVTATPRRKDHAEDVFRFHIGDIIHAASAQRMAVNLRRVFTPFKYTKKVSPRALKVFAVTAMIADQVRNAVIANEAVMALSKGRKLLVLSERLEHLDTLRLRITEAWGNAGNYGDLSFGFYVGGKTAEEREEAARARVVLATSQFASEGLDIPALDTLLLTTPMSDVEQAVGRIQRPCAGKCTPIVVDFRDDNVPLFLAMGAKRDRYYQKMLKK